jgi:hypothetical protein
MLETNRNYIHITISRFSFPKEMDEYCAGTTDLYTRAASRLVYESIAKLLHQCSRTSLLSFAL